MPYILKVLLSIVSVGIRVIILFVNITFELSFVAHSNP